MPPHPPLRSFYIVRHGESTANVDGTFAGTREVDLTPTGEEQAKALGEILKGLPVTRIVSSPQKRALRTAKLALIASGRADLSIETDNEIRERNYGDLQGLNKREFKEQHNIEALTADVLKAHGAETDDEIVARIPPAILEQLNKPGTPMFVAHSGTTKALMLGLLGHKTFTRPGNGEVWLFAKYEPGHWHASINGEPYKEPEPIELG